MPKSEINELEKVIIGLQKVREDINMNVSTRNFAAGLLAHYMTHKDLTTKQLRSAKSTIAKHRRHKKLRVKPRAPKKYYLYAMVAGDHVKLGFTSNIKKRKSQLQTGCAEKIDCVWSYPCGSSVSEAKSHEKKLHRYCSKYRERG